MVNVCFIHMMFEYVVTVLTGASTKVKGYIYFIIFGRLYFSKRSNVVMGEILQGLSEFKGTGLNCINIYILQKMSLMDSRKISSQG